MQSISLTSADIGTVFTRKDLAAFSQDLTRTNVEVEYHTHPASHVVGQLAELATSGDAQR